MSEAIKRPTIAELEKLLHETADGEIEVLPNGNVIRLSAAELIHKNLRFEVQQIEVLRNEARELRDKLKAIIKQIEELVP